MVEFFSTFFTVALILNFWVFKKRMLVAAKDDLRIQVTVLDHKVSITMPGMEDVIWLWNSWIRDEEKSAEKYLRSQYIENPYPLLSDYFSKKGWEIMEIRHQN